MQEIDQVVSEIVTAEVRQQDRGSRFSLETVGFLFSGFGLLLLFIALVFSVWLEQVVITILLALVLTAMASARLWSRLSLAGVSCERSLSNNRAFPGETVKLGLKIINRKPLPLPWVQLDDEIPVALTANLSEAVPLANGKSLVSNSAAIIWYSSLRRSYSLQCSKRGYYAMGPLTVSSGDMLGLYPRSKIIPGKDYLIVYPTLYPVVQPRLPALYPLGETHSQRRIFEDPTRTIGVRDYTFQDSLRHIHWKASARHQKLQVKVFEPTTTLKLALFLSVDSFFYEGIFMEDDFELAISAAGSIARYVSEHRNPAGVFVNSRLADSGQSLKIMPGRDKAQLNRILEGLAKVTYLHTEPFTDFLQRERQTLPWGTAVMLVVASYTGELGEMIHDLKKHNHKCLVLQVGKDIPSRPSADCFHVSCPEDLMNISFQE